MTLRIRVPSLGAGATLLYLRPDADDTDGGWTNEAGSATNLYASIDEAAVDDADYIQSGRAPSNDVCKISLGDPAYEVEEPVIVSYRYKSDGGTQTMELRVRLLEGSTARATWTHAAITSSFVTATQTLSGGEYASITDFNNLYLEFRGNAT